MKDSHTRVCILPFLIFDYRSMEDTLARMAAEGWKLKHIGGFLWKFKKAEPENRKYFVLYSREDSEMNSIQGSYSKPIKLPYLEDGWIKEIQKREIQIFSAEEDALPLKIEESDRVEGVCTTMNKTRVPSYTIGFFGMLFCAILNGMKYFGSSLSSDTGTGWAFLITLYTAILFGLELLGYAFWVNISKKQIEIGGASLRMNWLRRILNVMLFGFCAIVVAYLYH